MHVRYTKACCTGKGADSGISPPTGAAKHSQSVGTVRSAVFVSSGNGRDGAEPADGCRGNVRGDLLHEGVGGYVLEAVISFTAAVVLTALYIKFRKRKQIP